ncbi:protein GPR107 isoform X1 [Phlebotomus papatasi]|uniref:protein GPR107 isoform X1 n=1 Tax=Phlebotomus papatasi TaxID=29031 RepID=UPI002483F78B|nr:protein GPR107 isoform X1 [Phlebotomus papatasi]
MRVKLVFMWCLLVIPAILGRKHHLEIKDDYRRYIALSTFGFYQGGILDVKFLNFQVPVDEERQQFGLSLDKTLSDAMNPYLDTHQDKCILNEPASAQQGGPIIFIHFDLENKTTHIDCSRNWPPTVYIYKNRADIPVMRAKRHSLAKVSDSSIFLQRRRRATDVKSTERGIKCNQQNLPMNMTVKDGIKYYSLNFVLYVATKADEGLYNLYFHSCPNYIYPPKYSLNFNVDIEENNSGNYLSAGEMPLPALYFMMAVLFFLSGLFWIFILQKSKHPVFKIHYLMAVLVFLKSLSLFFHAINYHFIEIKGEHVAAWAILFYITHLLKGAVLFITIVLIGTGWTFIKHILADKDKKLFMIVIPLQVLANVAAIIIEESEVGDKEHTTWRDIFILVDLICCGAILFPVVWSIRHLQEASATDGKAATNLRKLKLFRQFYIMIVCYIYFTRIIVYLLKITVAFQYAWMDEMFREMANYTFFVLTAYKFRPASQHPYFTVTNSDDEDEPNEVLTDSGFTEGLTKVTNRSMPNATIVDGNEEERETLISKRESSHEYD